MLLLFEPSVQKVCCGICWAGSVFGGVGIAAKRDHPESVNDHDGVIGILDEVNELAGEAIERGDFAAAEIAYEDGIACIRQNHVESIRRPTVSSSMGRNLSFAKSVAVTMLQQPSLASAGVLANYR